METGWSQIRIVKSGANPYQPGRAVKIYAGFTSGQRVQKDLSFLMTDKTVNMYLENFIQISD